MSEQKKCSKFLFVDRFKIFADIDYSMYKESIENIKNVLILPSVSL